MNTYFMPLMWRYWCSHADRYDIMLNCLMLKLLLNNLSCVPRVCFTEYVILVHFQFKKHSCRHVTPACVVVIIQKQQKQLSHIHHVLFLSHLLGVGAHFSQGFSL